MYILMITDLVWTLMHHERAGEMNPIFARLLLSDEVRFVYLKLAANSLAAFAVIYLVKRRPVIGHLIAIFGIIVYGAVVWLHWFVDYSYVNIEHVQNIPLWSLLQAR
jgi:drug/metabolite transporter superfamily protein YnfA